MRKIFISQPMAGRPDEEVIEERKNIVRWINKNITAYIEIIDSFRPDYNGTATSRIGADIEDLGKADIAVFAPGWEKYRGCKIEHMVAKEYGEIIIIEVPSNYLNKLD